ncbi:MULTISPECIES: hypothetical protein [Rickettsiella]|jgi:hypothetical protein|uniref:hypothetical protein n=1 Tax=Rickettsiella TaxID=59195 RepID=UPI000AE2A33B|nr:hypothetical protein [Candidatus Rickettsiella isopodorum]
MLARILITLLLILIAVTTYTQTHHTIIYQPYAAHRLKIRMDQNQLTHKTPISDTS